MRSFEQLVLILVVLFLAFGVWGIIAAAIAQHKGRSAIGWFFGGVFLQLIGVVIVAVMPNLREDQAQRQWMENENRRLRERLRQEQVKSEASDACHRAAGRARRTPWSRYPRCQSGPAGTPRGDALAA